jgi:hypothetical protein
MNLQTSPIGPLIVFGSFGGFTLAMMAHAKKQKAEQLATVNAANANIDPATGYSFGSPNDVAVNSAFAASTAVTQGNSNAGTSPATEVNLVGSNGG